MSSNIEHARWTVMGLLADEPMLPVRTTICTYPLCVKKRQQPMTTQKIFSHAGLRAPSHTHPVELLLGLFLLDTLPRRHVVRLGAAVREPVGAHGGIRDGSNALAHRRGFAAARQHDRPLDVIRGVFRAPLAI